MRNKPKQNAIPLALLSTVIIGSGIAWLTLKSSNSEKGAGEKIEDTGQTEGKEAVQEAQKKKDEAKQSLSRDKKNQNSSYSHNPRGPFGSN